MAGRFMKIRRIVIPFISLVILLSQLNGCAALSSTELVEELNSGRTEVVLEYNELKSSESTSTDTTTSNVNSATSLEDRILFDAPPAQKSITIEDSEIGLLTPVASVDLQDLSSGALESYFTRAYDAGIALEGTVEERVNTEIEMLEGFVQLDGKGKLPAGYQDQYKAWRIIHQFTVVDETVYATSSVNLRSGPGTDYEKAGALGWGDAVNRIGVGTRDVDGWSRIKLADGSIVYVSSKYLSATRPVSSGGNAGGGDKVNSGSQGGGSQSQQKQTETPKPAEQKQAETPKSAEEPKQAETQEYVDPIGKWLQEYNAAGKHYDELSEEAKAAMPSGIKTLLENHPDYYLDENGSLIITDDNFTTWESLQEQQ